ncbi:uncharacterized protein BKA55DRAFT_696501 [Fusarium redolens]|uniref:Uncharacterized protein n=1 Tax=Fusarium redolens TaxID=48865 RepID=A0A9P9G127_FUSRE|nr:uncharacterized protein BKA55DRAFT_696501 [Fusarium redolens]KAH7230566.1 hypothetical protein BKA55DRAFT_696501 [Fusarium redolens]
MAPRIHQVSDEAKLDCSNPGTSTVKTDLVKDEESDLLVSGAELSGLVTSSFFCTFEGVSELSTSPTGPAIWSLIITITSFLAMISIHIIALWRGEWFSVGAIMVFVGYGCMVTGVSSAGYPIYPSRLPHRWHETKEMRA